MSSHGRVKNKKTGRFLKPRVNNFGYLRVLLINAEGKKEFQIHRLVAEAFLSNPENLETVDHIIPDKTNNNAENLQWLTREDNSRKANSKPVSQYYKNGDFVANYASATEASR